MKTLTTRLFLFDIHGSKPTSKALALLRSSSSSSSARKPSHLRRSMRTYSSSSDFSPSPLIRRPGDRFSSGGDQRLLGGNRNFGLSTSKSDVVDEMESFLELVPMRMRRELVRHQEIESLIEVVMDLGRKPIARFPSGDWVISQSSVKVEDLRHAISKVGDFSDDNRSGIDRSLHRISAIRNRKTEIIGLTCRVGRAVAGSADMIRDLVESGDSILVIGPPGVGKTTLIREIARMLADDHMKRVIIIDTSNEIGGDGDVPHAGIGRARRMQVPNVNMQHDVMIEAVENHMPETIVIDEIGTELEALAAGTIAQRGVQLVGTAHGMTIDSIIKNPSLQSLVGGIESVTLGDDEAKRRKVQKTILERKGPPTFTCAVEIISRNEYRVHRTLEATVDAILAGRPPQYEVRRVDTKADESTNSGLISERYVLNDSNTLQDDSDEDERLNTFKASPPLKAGTLTRQIATDRSSPIRLYPYKMQEADLLQVAEVMGLENDIEITEDVGTADAILALRSELKKNPGVHGVANFHQIPLYVLKTNTMAQIVKGVRLILGMDTLGAAESKGEDLYDGRIEIEEDAPKRRPSLEEIDALEEVRLAIEYIVIPGGEPVELLPRCSEIIARQLELVESYQLAAERTGTESNSRLQILPQKIGHKKQSLDKNSSPDSRSAFGWNSQSSNTGATSVSRLPLLPE